MINIHGRFAERWPSLRPSPTTRNTPTEPRTRAPRVILQMHDELVFEIPEEDLAEVAAIVRTEMENAVRLNGVPLPVSIYYGSKWGSLQPYKPED